MQTQIYVGVKDHVRSINTSVDNILTVALTFRPPSHSDKDHKGCTAFLKLDKRRENGMKTVFKFVLRLIPRLCQCVTASNELQLSLVARLIRQTTRPLRFQYVFSKTFQTAPRAHYAFPKFSLCPSRSCKSSPRALRSHSYCKFSGVNNRHTNMPPNKGC